MLDFWIGLVFLAEEAAEVGLAELVAAAGGASAKFHTAFCHSLHAAVAQGFVGIAQHERERIVAAALGGEIGAIFFGVELVEETVEVARAGGVVGVEAREL